MTKSKPKPSMTTVPTRIFISLLDIRDMCRETQCLRKDHGSDDCVFLRPSFKGAICMFEAYPSHWTIERRGPE